jgi:hypothetical protein
MAKAAEWAKRVAEWRASGLKAKDFCVDREFSPKSLWHWSSKLARAAEEHHARKPAVRLVRVARQTPVPPPSASGIVMEVAGAKLTLHGHVDEVALRTVVMTLRGLRLQDAQ